MEEPWRGKDWSEEMPHKSLWQKSKLSEKSDSFSPRFSSHKWLNLRRLALGSWISLGITSVQRERASLERKMPA